MTILGEVLEQPTWEARARSHASRVDAYVAPHLARRDAGVRHPVHDFLFGYYSQRPAQLRRWHPGYGVRLAGGAGSHGAQKGYAVVGADGGDAEVTAAYVASQVVLLGTLRRLLAATAARPASYGCFGLHEWAMVYRLADDETRHADWPLRLGGRGTDEVVESHRIACSHFDAFRFFTEPARPRNTLLPSADDRPEFEQPGCLHAGMDLYKHAFRLSPMIASDLVADCFELAWDIRELDMRAAPYDLADLGFDPVRIETAEGKKEYAAAQATFAERGAPLRARLVAECDRLLASVSGDVAVRVATPADAAEVARVYVASWNAGLGERMRHREDTPGEIERWRTELDGRGTTWRVALLCDQVVGVVGTRPSRDPVEAGLVEAGCAGLGEVDTVAVDPDAWRRGVGRSLMRHAVADLRAAGFTSAVLWTLTDYAPGDGFYRATGWLPDGATRDDGHEAAYRRSL